MNFVRIRSVSPRLRAALLCAAILSTQPGSTRPFAAEPENHAVLANEKIRAVIANNAPYGPDHRAGYNGLAELSLASEEGRNLFVPQYAGLNFEHVFSGDAASFGWNIFEPRLAPMQLVRLSPSKVELRQERTEHWPLRSRVAYEMDGDAVEMTYCGTPTATEPWSKHRFIGVFFASYMQAPPDMSIRFIGRSAPGQGDTRPRWIRHHTPAHGTSASHRPAGVDWNPPLDESFNIALVKGDSGLEYLYPFYFGRSGDRILLMMFDRPRDGGEVRFAQSPSGGGKGNPAWDFYYLHRNVAAGKEFCFRARAVCRKFGSLAEIIRTYEQWSGEKVVSPAAGEGIFR